MTCPMLFEITLVGTPMRQVPEFGFQVTRFGSGRSAKRA
jgi:hypothetical protein